MQQAFVDHNAFPMRLLHARQILSAIACREGGHANSDAAIPESMSGIFVAAAPIPTLLRRESGKTTTAG